MTIKLKASLAVAGLLALVGYLAAPARYSSSPAPHRSTASAVAGPSAPLHSDSSAAKSPQPTAGRPSKALTAPFPAPPVMGAAAQYPAQIQPPLPVVADMATINPWTNWQNFKPDIIHTKVANIPLTFQKIRITSEKDRTIWTGRCVENPDLRMVYSGTPDCYDSIVLAACRTSAIVSK